MSKRYKLVINNHHKHLITEALEDHTFEDTQNFLKNIFKLISNTTQAVIVLVGAQTEYLTLATTFANKISIKKITETFVKKIEFASKLFDEAISDNVRADVDMLYAINNPAYFIGRKLLDFISEDKEKNLEMYIPYWWFIKDIVVGDFFKTEVKEFGELFGGKLQNNTIVWWYGWFAQDLIMGSKQFLEESLRDGLFEKFGVWKGIKSIEELKIESPNMARFLIGFESIEILTGSTREFYNFLRRNEDTFNKISYYTALSTAENPKTSFFLHYKYLQNDLLLKKRKYELLKNEGDTSNLDLLQREIDELTQQLEDAKSMKFEDENNPGNMLTATDLDQLEQDLDSEYIKIYENADEDSDDKTPITVIDELISKYKEEASRNPNLKKDLEKVYRRLESYRDNLLKKKYADTYGKQNFTNDLSNESLKTQKLIEIHKKLMQFEKLLKSADKVYKPNSSDNPTEMLKKISDEYIKDLKNTVAKMHQQNVAIIPDILETYLGPNADQFLYEFLDTFYTNGKTWVKDKVGVESMKNYYQELQKNIPILPNFTF